MGNLHCSLRLLFHFDQCLSLRLISGHSWVSNLVEGKCSVTGYSLDADLFDKQVGPKRLSLNDVSDDFSCR